MNLVRFYNSNWIVLILIVCAIICGIYIPQFASYTKPIGDIFINLIKMMLVPVVLFSIISATSKISQHANALKIGGFALLYFFISGFVSGIFGSILAILAQPGKMVGSLDQSLFATTDQIDKLNTTNSNNFVDFIMNLIPYNPIQAIAEGKLLPILFFSIFFGLSMAYIKNDQKQIFINSVGVITEGLMWMINKIMYLAPIAIFALMFYLISTLGIDILFSLGLLFAVIVFACFVWIYIILGLVVVASSKITYMEFVKNTFSLVMFAFSTSSSLVSLPKNIDTCDNLNVKKETSRFILPLAANLNMNGSAFYYTIVTIFFAQMFGVEINLYTILLISITASIGAMTTPGIPGASLTIVMVMIAAGVPLIGIPIFFALDRLLDMFITTVNVVGDTVCSIVGDSFFK